MKKQINLRLLLITITMVGLIAACASSSKNGDNTLHYKNLVTLQEPGNQPHREAKIYIDSVKKSTQTEPPGLVIHGTFPDGCTNLKEVSHHFENDDLYVDVKAWRNPDMMCTQALTPFTFIYTGLTLEELTSQNKATVNGSIFNF